MNRTNKPAPEIAKDYWRLPADATLLDVIYAVRSDESTHRFVNHSLANLNPNTDVNPFALREPDMSVKGTKLGYVHAILASFSFVYSVVKIRVLMRCFDDLRFERDEAERYVQDSHKIVEQAKQQ